MKLEIKRQAVHLLGVFFVVSSYFIPASFFLLLLFFMFVFSSTICLLRPFSKKLGLLKSILDYLHNLARDEEKKLGLYFGAATFFLGALVTFWIFGVEIFRIAMLVLSAGDSFSTLIGTHYGSRKLFYNKKKTWEGLIMGTSAAFAACLFIVPLNIALLAAAVGMIVESAPVQINDNLSIPLAVALVMVVVL
ncbi:MAG: hypothetical protein ABIF92_03170 [archaeon]